MCHIIDIKFIFVADRGLNTSDNIYFLNGDNKGDYNLGVGYIEENLKDELTK